MATPVTLYTEADRETFYSLKCVCGHPISSHGFYPPPVGELPFTVWVSQCVHPGCNFSQEIPRTDRRRKKTYEHVSLCEEFRQAE